MLARLPGFEVVGEAESGEASIEAARQLRPDLVLMDVHMPGIGGPEATRRIMAQTAAHPPVVVLLSTYDAADFAPRADECGAAAYLPKGEFAPMSCARPGSLPGPISPGRKLRPPWPSES